MTLSCDETKLLIERVLKWNASDATKKLHTALIFSKQTEQEFYAGIIEHGPGLKLSSEQWFELLSRITTWFLRSQLNLENILSEEQRRKLPPPTG